MASKSERDAIADFVRSITDPAWIPDRTVLLCLSGSRAYGLHSPESDYDVRGVALPPRHYFTGTLYSFQQTTKKGVFRRHERERDVDVCIYDLRRFVTLAADCNPNVIELLFARDEDIVWMSPVGMELRRNRNLFLSTKAVHTFSGYAMGQLKRIRTHRKWLLDPPRQPPTRAEFGLPEETVLSADILGAIEVVERAATNPVATNPEGLTLPAHVMEIYRKERSYQNKLREWRQYQDWKQSRNSARAELEARFGYDTKHAMHLVRLMRMGIELLQEGTLHVRRTDALELLEVRRGAWSYDELIAWAAAMDTHIRSLEATAVVPKRPNRKAIDRLVRELVDRYVMQEGEVEDPGDDPIIED